MPAVQPQEKILTQAEAIKTIQELEFTIAMQHQVIDKLEKDNNEAWNKTLAYAREVDTMTGVIFESPYKLKSDTEM